MKSTFAQFALNTDSISNHAAKHALPLVVLIAFGFVTQFAHGQTLTTLYSFTGACGIGPQAGVVRDNAGNLYGTTYGGNGSCGFGTVFKLNTAGNLKVLHRFTGGARRRISRRPLDPRRSR